MQSWMKYCALACFSFSIQSYASSLTPSFHHVIETMSPSSNCPAWLSGHTVRADFSYYYMPSISKGVGLVLVENPTSSNPPITADLYQSGDSDRIGFAHYYYAPGFPITIDHKKVYMRGVVLDVCPDQSTVAAVVMLVPKAPSSSKMQQCNLVSSNWYGYCRGDLSKT